MAAPTRIGRYELLFPIGTGGMGTVYLGRHNVVDGVMRDVAVKLINVSADPHGPSVDELLDEARVAARLVHPNIVSVTDVMRVERSVVFVMDYVDGVPLSKLIRSARRQNERLPWPVVARILCDALAGLAALHGLTDEDGRALSMIHRDVSPENLLVGADGITKLTDFGIAKGQEPPSRQTDRGIIKGKLPYLSPEHAQGLPIDQRTDVWAGGVVLWEALGGRRLFGGSKQLDIIMQILSARVPSLSLQRDDVPAELDALLAEVIHVEPTTRCASAELFRRQLLRVASLDDTIAEHDEVAALVHRLVGASLASRRKRARAASKKREPRGRPELSSLTDIHVPDDVETRRSAPPPSPERALDPAVAQLGLAETERDLTTPEQAELAEQGQLHTTPMDPQQLLSEPPPSQSSSITQDLGFGPTESAKQEWLGARRRRVPTIALALTGLALVALLSAALLVWPGRGGQAQQLAGPWLPQPRITLPAAAAEPAPAAGASSSAVAPGREHVVRLWSKVPIAAVILPSRDERFAEPRQSVEVELRAGERAGVKLTVIAQDGRQSKVAIAPGQPLAEIVFSAPRSAPRSKPKPAIPGPGIAPSVY